MLLKQEDKESNLFLWLLVYFAEDLDIKKKPNIFLSDSTEETNL